jgi:thiamine-phosphate pyrophosphorylase
VKQAKKAEADGADFITLGPVYETPSKMCYGAPLGPDIIKRAKEEVSIPIFAIGGVRKERVCEVLKAGADGIALISAILASESIQSDTEEFMRLLK